MADIVEDRNPAAAAILEQLLRQQRPIIDHAIRVLLQKGAPGPNVLKMLIDTFFAVKWEVAGRHLVGPRRDDAPQKFPYTEDDSDAHDCFRAVLKLIMSNHELREEAAATAANETPRGVSAPDIAPLEAQVEALMAEVKALAKKLGGKEEDSKADIEDDDSVSLEDEDSVVAPKMRTWPVVKLDRED